MRILLVSPIAPPAGGIASWTKNYLNFFEKEDTVFLVNTAVFKKRGMNLQKLHIFEELRRFFRILIDFIRVVKNEEVDFIHINSSCSAFGMLREIIMILLANKTKILIHFHCDISEQVGKNKLKLNLLNYIILNSQEILVLNEKSKDFIQNNFRMVPKKLPNFIPAHKIEKVNSKDQFNNKIVYVGHVKKEKGCEDILEVAKLLPNYNFKLVGNIDKKFLENNIPKNVLLTGELSLNDVEKEMIDSDILLFLSYSEGFPMVILEAMNFNLPLIATNVGAVKEILNDAEIQVLDDRNLANICHRIMQLSDKNIINHIIEKNKEKLISHYTDELVLTELRNIYRGLNENYI